MRQQSTRRHMIDAPIHTVTDKAKRVNSPVSNSRWVRHYKEIIESFIQSLMGTGSFRWSPFLGIKREENKGCCGHNSIAQLKTDCCGDSQESVLCKSPQDGLQAAQEKASVQCHSCCNEIVADCQSNIKPPGDKSPKSRASGQHNKRSTVQSQPTQ